MVSEYGWSIRLQVVNVIKNTTFAEKSLQAEHVVQALLSDLQPHPLWNIFEVVNDYQLDKQSVYFWID